METKQGLHEPMCHGIVRSLCGFVTFVALVEKITCDGIQRGEGFKSRGCRYFFGGPLWFEEVAKEEMHLANEIDDKKQRTE